MKKLLLAVMAISFVATTFAQVSQYTPKKWYNTVTAHDNVPQVDPQSFSTEINPTVSSSRAADVVVGETWYDLQTNSSMPNRIFAFEDGTIGATWTRGMTHVSYPDRGTGYNYHDGSSWGPYPTERIEEVRTGWPNYAPYGANGEIVCTHSGGNSGLVFSWRETKGTGDWNYFNLVGPAGHEDILWPRMVTSGENNEIIHVICVTPGVANDGSIYEDLDGALLYSRSADGGQTWDPMNMILEGVSADYTSGWGGDDYAFAQPQGENLAFFAFGGIRDGVVMKSTDGGDNWERMLVYESPMPFFTGEEGTLPQCGGGDGYNAVAIDDEGMVHVAFGRQVHLDEDPAAGWNYYPYSDGLVYWNEAMPALDTAKLTADIIPDDWETHYLYQNGNLAAWTQPNGEDTIVGIPYYGASMTTMPQIVTMRDEMGVKIVQVFYSAISVGFDNSENNFHHIWGRFTEGDGLWSAFTDYTGDVFHIFSECVYPSVAPKAVNGKFHILYQTDNMPGTSTQPDPPQHDPILNNIVYLAVSPLPVDVEETVAGSLEISQNFPNPFNGNTFVEVTLAKTANISVEVTTLTGQKVAMNDYGHKMAGTHTISIDGSQLTTGIYFYTVTAGDQKVTRKMMVN